MMKAAVSGESHIVHSIFCMWIAGISESEDQNDDDDEETAEYATEDEPDEHNANEVDTNEVLNQL